VNSKKTSDDGMVKHREDTIVQEIQIRRPAERVFEAMTNADELVKWWRVDGKFQITQMESDLRPGGKWRMRLIGGHGAETVVSGEFRTVERPHLLIFSWIRETEDATETVVRWELEEKDGITTVRVTHSGLATESLRKRNDGWPMILGLLQGYSERTP
jgi:uncharacterized protein YndB with AHSA1/START domain